ncbi:hypothetical protein OV208_02890 [Corallococcus sp. bb12-1]|uniref:hypothetical protein n=1 Tax=Corallococcus sp. bb12-1 TaxID=2996784 RepID=UPI002271CC5D|nr:hypothetical protein [Corallococcus sp. bb12-1]MCY1040254.1 hypothetical protein [Corallococcus sp. bb12-1]
MGDPEPTLFENWHGLYDPGIGNQCGYLPEDDSSKPLNAPPPGQCVDTDAAYTRTGIIKIPDTYRCEITCDSEGGYGGLACSCWSFPKRDTNYITPEQRKEWGWPQNPWLAVGGGE